jgi:predicted DNA-binding protein
MPEQPVIPPAEVRPEVQNYTVRVSRETRRTLHQLSAMTGRSIASIIGMLATEELNRQQAQKGDK